MLGGRESMTWKVTFYDDDDHDGCDGDSLNESVATTSNQTDKVLKLVLSLGWAILMTQDCPPQDWGLRWSILTLTLDDGD